ncbi:MAG: hypothetical protein GX957_16145, partial [Clostridiaceae bacterium]|nr:hypothetical protein [Clostridiaceae bacterium]
FTNSVKEGNTVKTGQYLSFNIDEWAIGVDESLVDNSQYDGTNLTYVVVSRTSTPLPTIRIPFQSNLNEGMVLYFDEIESWGGTGIGVFSDRVTLRFGSGSWQTPRRGWEYIRNSSTSLFTYTYGMKNAYSESIYINGQKIELDDPNLNFYTNTDRYDGVEVREQNLTSAHIGSSSNVGMIGKGYQNPAWREDATEQNAVYYDGEIAEIMVISKALTDEEISMLNAYIEEKYKISEQEILLPSFENSIVWMDASKGVVTADQGGVTEWKNMAAKAQSDAVPAANLPTLIKDVDSLKGASVVRFAGNDYLQLSKITDINISGLTMVVVSKPDMNAPIDANRNTKNLQIAAGSGQRASAFYVQQSGDWGGTGVGVFNDAMVVRFGSLASAERAWVYNPTDKTAFQSFSLAVAVKEGKSEMLYLNNDYIYNDLVQVANNTNEYSPGSPYSNTGSTLSNNKTSAFIGKGEYPDTYNGDIAEIIVYDKALTENELDQLEAYISQKYGIGEKKKISEIAPYNQLLAWYDASSLTGIVNDGEKVGYLPDKSGNGHSAVQFTSGNQPTWVKDAYNGKPTLRFSGNQWLKFNDVNLNGFDAKRTLVIVSKAGNAFNASSDILANDKTRINQKVPLFFDQTADWGQVFLGVFNDAVTLRYGPGNYGISNRGWLYLRNNQANDITFTYALKDGKTESIYVDGEKIDYGDNLKFLTSDKMYTDKQSINNAIASYIQSTSTDGWIGRGNANTYYTGDISEILIFNTALTEKQIDILNEYLNYKYKGGEKPSLVAEDLEEVYTKAGTAPVLPNTVVVHDPSDLSAQEYEINWDNIDQAQYSKAGMFEVTGTVKDLDITVKVKIMVREYDDSRDVKGAIPQNPMAHYSASGGGLVRKNGKLVWEDLSGNGLDAVAESEDNAPTYLPAGGSRLFSSFSFDGVNDYLKLDGYDWNRKDAQFTVIAVSKSEENMPLYYDDFVRNIHLSPVIAFAETRTWGQMFLSVYKDLVTMRFGAGAKYDEDYQMRGWYYIRPEMEAGYTYTIAEKNRSDEKLFVNGSAVEAELESLNGTSNDTYGISSYGWIGKAIRNGDMSLTDEALYYKGEIAEIIIYDRVLSKEEKLALNQYLSYKYLNKEYTPDEDKPGNGSEPTDNNPGNEGGKDTTKPIDPPKTGNDENVINFVVCFASLSLLVITRIVYRRRKPI